MNEWIFTFGFGQVLQAPSIPYGGIPLNGKYVRVYADDAEEARRQMVAWFGRNWAFQYDSEEKAGIDQFNLKALVL